MGKNAIFLSGWEYNRVLQVDPLTSVQSALPVEAFWNGAAQFWLFEKVYCTRESFEGEVRCLENIGYASGFILKDLQRRGFLHTFDWQDIRENSPLHYQQLCKVHGHLHEKYDETAIIELLKNGNEIELEAIKLELLIPIFAYLDCVNNISPNSIGFWADKRHKKMETTTSLAIDMLRRPIQNNKKLQAGFRLCNPPGTGVLKQERQAQKEIERNVQRPLIPYLFCGRLAHQEYLDLLRPSASVYKPINTQLLNEYNNNIDRLERLRDLASKHLWNSLHGEWLPRLEQDPSFLSQFQVLLRDALLMAKLAQYLDFAAHIAIAVISTGVGLTTHNLATVAPISPDIAQLAGTSSGLATGKILSDAYKSLQENAKPLTLFYQQALQQIKRA